MGLRQTCLSVLQVKAPILDEEGNDLSTFLPDGADNAASPGTKRAAAHLDTYSSGSSSEDDTTADDNLKPGADAAGPADRRQPQIIFCSRTHSQLSQFVGELHRTRFTDSILLVAVASRKALCVNDEVRCSNAQQALPGAVFWAQQQQHSNVTSSAQLHIVCLSGVQSPIQASPGDSCDMSRKACCIACPDTRIGPSYKSLHSAPDLLYLHRLHPLPAAHQPSTVPSHKGGILRAQGRPQAF